MTPLAKRIAAFAADGLALARRKRGEEIVERGVAGIFPVKLLVGALQKAAFAEEFAFRLGGEGDVNAGSLIEPAELEQARGERLTGGVGMRAWLDQEPASGHRRERHRDLELWIIAAAGALIGLGPAAVEHIFTARVAFDVAGRGGERRAAGGFDDEVLRLPAGPSADRAGLLQRRQEIMRYERVIDVFLIYSLSFSGALPIPRWKRWGKGAASIRGTPCRVGAGVPLRRRHLADAAHRLDAQIRAFSLVTGRGLAVHAHGLKPSKIIWSAQRAARCRSAGVRTAQVSSGMLKTCRANKGASAGRSAIP